jgi:hypothetical protein
MDNRGQATAAGVWGFAAVLLATSIVILLDFYKNHVLGFSELAAVEAIVGLVLLFFAVISFYVAHK